MFHLNSSVAITILGGVQCVRGSGESEHRGANPADCMFTRCEPIDTASNRVETASSLNTTRERAQKLRLSEIKLQEMQ